jgi:hypothetical protein
MVLTIVVSAMQAWRFEAVERGVEMYLEKPYGSFRLQGKWANAMFSEIGGEEWEDYVAFVVAHGRAQTRIIIEEPDSEDEEEQDDDEFKTPPVVLRSMTPPPSAKRRWEWTAAEAFERDMNEDTQIMAFAAAEIAEADRAEVSTAGEVWAL